jgi:hypothetical protein
VDDPFDLGARDGFAEEVARFDGGLDGVALEDAGGGGLDGDLVLRLLVLLDIEVADVDELAVALKSDAVVAEGCIGFEV